jgi:integrase
VDTITTDDVLATLKTIRTTKPETASRVRGRIEKVLDAAKAKGFRSGENPARWRGHLDHLLPKQSKLARGHHAAMPYEKVADFIGELRQREATAALALEFCVLTAARSGEVLGAVVRVRSRGEGVDGAGGAHEGRSRAPCPAI